LINIISNNAGNLNILFSECGFPLAISKDVSYCRIADTYKLLHPNVVLEDLVIFRDYGG
jgi:hypothetical protein